MHTTAIGAGAGATVPARQAATSPRRVVAPLPDVEVRGPVSAAALDHLQERLLEVASQLRQPVLWERVRLTRRPVRQSWGPGAVAEARADLNGRVVRAQVAAPTMAGAIDLLARRLVSKAVSLDIHWRTVREVRDRAAARPAHRPARWWDGWEPRPLAPPASAGPWQVTSTTRVRLVPRSTDAAVGLLESTDHLVHLFLDERTGEGRALFRARPGRYVMTGPEPQVPSVYDVVLPNRRPARLTSAQACSALAAERRGFLVFVDAGSGRPAFVYRRFDGDLGQVTAADDTAGPHAVHDLRRCPADRVLRAAGPSRSTSAGFLGGAGG